MKHGMNLFWQIILVLLVVLGALLRVRRALDEGLSKSEPSNPRGLLRDAALGVCSAAAPQNLRFTTVLTSRVRPKASTAC